MAESIVKGDIEGVLDIFRLHYRERELAAREKGAAGTKIVGYLSNNVPVELILAAGMFPVQLTGNPGEDTAKADDYMEPFFDGQVRSIFNRLLVGHFDFVDLVIIPRTSEEYLQLYYFLQEVRKWEPHLDIPETYLFDLLHTHFWATGRYNRTRLDDLKERLERLSGRKITNDALGGAVETTDKNRVLLDQVNALRRETPPRLSGSEALRVIGAAAFMDKEGHSAALGQLLGCIEDLQPLSGLRLMVKGHGHDTTRFYEFVEARGAVIVSDDHVWGERMFEYPIRETGNLMEAINEKYHLYSVSPRAFPQAVQNERFLELADRAKVEGVIFFHNEWDDTLGWDYPVQKALLDQRGIPSVFLKNQSYRNPDRDEQEQALDDLMTSILHGKIET